MPLYETPAQRARERAVAGYVAPKMNCHPVEFPQKSRADYVFTTTTANGEEAKYLVEIKTRNIGVDDYDDYMIEKAKVDTLVETAAVLNVTPIIVVEYRDAVTVAVLTDTEQYRTGWNRRKDRAGEQNKEMTYIPVSEMTILH